jgi:hypothetical protein
MNFDRHLAQLERMPEYRRCAGLLKRHRIEFRTLAQIIYSDVKAVLPYLIPGCSYTAEDLCGPEIWKQYPTHGLHRAIGICLSMMVKMSLLPLMCTNPRNSNKCYALDVQSIKHLLSQDF